MRLLHILLVCVWKKITGNSSYFLKLIFLSLFMWQRYIIHWWMFAICHNYLLVLLSYLYKLHNPILHIRKTGYRQYHCVIVLNFSMFCQAISIFHKNIKSCFKLRNICCCAQLGTEFVCSLTGILEYTKIENIY